MAAVRVQTVKRNLADGVSSPWVTAAFGSPVTAGHLLVVFIKQAGSTDIVTGVTDSAGNTYTRMAALTGQNPSVWGYYCANVLGGSSVTVSVATSATSSSAWIFCAEYSGVFATSPLDAAGARNAGGSADMTSSPFTTTCRGLVLMIGTNSGAPTFTAGVDFTLVDGAIQGNSINCGGLEEYVNGGEPLSGYVAHITASGASVPNVVLWAAFKSGPPPTGMFAHGSLTWLQASTVGTVYTIVGIPFQPKALRFYTMGQEGAGNGGIQYDMRRNIGVAAGVADRRVVASINVRPANPTRLTSIYRDDCIAVTSNRGGTAAVEGQLDFTGFTADGFTLTVDAQIVFNISASTSNIQVFWEAWGGAAITVAHTVEIAEPAATGNQDYAVTGFVAGATDQVLMLAGSNMTGAPPVSARTDAVMMAGVATVAFQWVALGASRDNVTPSQTARYGLSGECLANKTIGAATINARATLTQWNTDGFRLNWLARGSTGRKYIALALKGGQWAAGEATLNWGTVNNTATVTGLPFKPIGLQVAMAGTIPESSPGTPSTSDILCIGTGIGTGTGVVGSSLLRRLMTSYAQEANSFDNTNNYMLYDRVLGSVDTSDAISASADISQVNADGFQVKVTVSPGAATGWFGYLAFGVPASALTKVKLGTVTPSSLRVGTTTAPKAYIGTTQVWG